MSIFEKLQRENIALGSVTKRAFAFCIDEMLVSMLLSFAYWDSFSMANTYDEIVALLSSLVVQLLFLKIAYHTFFVWYYGASIGKIALKISCIDTELLDKPDFKSSLLRAIFRVISEACFYLGFLWALGDNARQTWHDKIAKTVVIDVA